MIFRFIFATRILLSSQVQMWIKVQRMLFIIYIYTHNVSQTMNKGLFANSCQGYLSAMLYIFFLLFYCKSQASFYVAMFIRITGFIIFQLCLFINLFLSMCVFLSTNLRFAPVGMPDSVTRHETVRALLILIYLYNQYTHTNIHKVCIYVYICGRRSLAVTRAAEDHKGRSLRARMFESSTNGQRSKDIHSG